MARTSYNRSDDDIRFVLYQQAKTLVGSL